MFQYTGWDLEEVHTSASVDLDSTIRISPSHWKRDSTTDPSSKQNMKEWLRYTITVGKEGGVYEVKKKIDIPKKV